MHGGTVYLSLQILLQISVATEHVDTFPCSPSPRWPEVYECAVHVGQRHRAQISSPSGQPSSILVFCEWLIGCHKLGLIAVCCSQQRSFQFLERPGNKTCTQKQCVWRSSVSHVIRCYRTHVCTSITQLTMQENKSMCKFEHNVGHTIRSVAHLYSLHS